MQNLFIKLLSSVLMLLISLMSGIHWIEKDSMDSSLYLSLSLESCVTTGILDGHCTEWPNQNPPTRQCLLPTNGEVKDCNRCASTPPPSTGCDVE